MLVALLTIGTEITRGELQNTNTRWLAERITESGHTVTEMSTVEDDDTRIKLTLKRLCQQNEVVICTGGLGPTTDDRTTACAASVADLTLVRDESALQHIKELFRDYGREMSRSNEKQADFPEGAITIENQLGTARGFSLNIEKATVYFLPGVPREMRPMFDDSIAPHLPPPLRPTVCIKLRAVGMAEAEINDRLDGLEAEYKVTLGYRASHSEIEIKVLATSSTRTEANSLAEKVASLVEKRLGSIVYSRGTTPLAAVIGQILVERGLTLALAESCTGGLVSGLVTNNSGASQYYKGGVCAYSNSVKTSILQVSTDTLNKHGAVSCEVARQMVEGVRTVLDADVALAITGLAGPLGGTKEKPVGLVHWAVTDGTNTVSKHKIFRGTREQIQLRAAIAALNSVRKLLVTPEQSEKRNQH